MRALATRSVPHEAEEAMILLHVDCKNSPSSLEIVLEGLIQLYGSLNLDQGSKLRLVILDVESAGTRLFFQKCMGPRNTNIMYPDIGVMTSAKFNFVNIIEVN